MDPEWVREILGGAGVLGLVVVVVRLLSQQVQHWKGIVEAQAEDNERLRVRIHEMEAEMEALRRELHRRLLGSDNIMEIE